MPGHRTAVPSTAVPISPAWRWTSHFFLAGAFLQTRCRQIYWILYTLICLTFESVERGRHIIHSAIATFYFPMTWGGLTGYLFGAGNPEATSLCLESNWHTAFGGKADGWCSVKIKSLGKIQAPGPEQSCWMMVLSGSRSGNFFLALPLGIKVKTKLLCNSD